MRRQNYLCYKHGTLLKFESSFFGQSVLQTSDTVLCSKEYILSLRRETYIRNFWNHSCLIKPWGWNAPPSANFSFNISTLTRLQSYAKHQLRWCLYNLFVTSRNETMNSPIHQFTNLNFCMKARAPFKTLLLWCIISCPLL